MTYNYNKIIKFNTTSVYSVVCWVKLRYHRVSYPSPPLSPVEDVQGEIHCPTGVARTNTTVVSSTKVQNITVKNTAVQNTAVQNTTIQTLKTLQLNILSLKHYSSKHWLMIYFRKKGWLILLRAVDWQLTYTHTIIITDILMLEPVVCMLFFIRLMLLRAIHW